ncbi:hypothetical protein BOVA604_2413 [Bacteroides ovatus]|jgi:hypothetical protein bacD2_18847|uniref:YciI family protein n=1 Tax=Bacteroides TaxID=816 RepID=UPI000E9ECB88|nr:MULTISPECIES: YciI family protein [Bacteroides]MCS3179577.1 YciI family protein [Candidatus Bacteroides intestinigallinarum]RGN60003.1 GTP cyclohydrolase [Bacteroides sp. OM05-10AA]RGQ65720.1 GTP cyclohydrolase [Bacteroides sp. AF27-33]CAG9895298.1 hypothetical protein BOVA604_2413 [Bacteroides ovatus]
MFVLILTYKAPIEKVLELLDAHCRFLDKYYNAGNFLASGPQIPRTGGVILCRATDRVEVEEIIKEDPFNEIADYQIIEFEPNKSIEGFKDLLNV